MNFKQFIGHVNGLRDDCLVKGLELSELDVYVTRSSGDLIFGVMDKEQEIIGYFKWEASL